MGEIIWQKLVGTELADLPLSGDIGAFPCEEEIANFSILVIFESKLPLEKKGA